MECKFTQGIRYIRRSLRRRFQWAYLQIKQLLELLTEAAIRDRLGRLPISIKATYETNMRKFLQTVP